MSDRQLRLCRWDARRNNTPRSGQGLRGTRVQSSTLWREVVSLRVTVAALGNCRSASEARWRWHPAVRLSHRRTTVRPPSGAVPSKGHLPLAADVRYRGVRPPAEARTAGASGPMNAIGRLERARGRTCAGQDRSALRPACSSAGRPGADARRHERIACVRGGRVSSHAATGFGVVGRPAREAAPVRCAD